MSDLIQLLPDNIANQIAAGEVIQRPSSAVKELLENAVDAGSDEIRLIIQDAGKSLVQVIDNGSGMTETDARMAFERHATSKIRNIDDLFQIRTMGFRGEALASIAAVAQVELKTRMSKEEAGTRLEIENSVVKRQEPVAHPRGTSIAMKNLFFNVPARRNFLKSNASELRHIVEEFTRVAMAFPDIFFSLTSNGQEVFHLEKGNLRQRVLQILGSQYNSKLVPVNEKTEYLNISGFIGKPDSAKKTRGDQYFFVNRRFIRSPYLHHAVMQAFDQLLPADSYPAYVIFIELDPAVLDINVHPTKQEIKFEDEKIVYAFIQSAVKHALAQFSIAPTLDFELDPGIEKLESISQPHTFGSREAGASPDLLRAFSQKNQAHFIEGSSDLKHWREFFEPGQSSSPETAPRLHETVLNVPEFDETKLLQLDNTYILVALPRGFRLVHQQNAHERVLYDSFRLADSGNRPIPSQRSIFPSTFELSASDSVILEELLPELNQLGFQVESFGKNSFAIQGSPASIEEGAAVPLIENMLEQYKYSGADVKLSQKEKIWKALASQQAIKPGKQLSLPEMQDLISKLFQSSMASLSPSGKSVFLNYSYKELEGLFGK